MKTFSITILLTFVLSSISFSQKDKEDKYNKVYISANINYYSPIDSYSFTSTVDAEHRDVVLSYITSNSGTFEIEDGNTELNREDVIGIPSQIMSLGLSFQIRNSYSIFHEFSLSRFSISNSSLFESYNFQRSNGVLVTRTIGYEQKSAIFGVRYEFGKYFGRTIKPKVRFGLSAAIEPSHFYYRRIPRATNAYPARASIFSIEAALIPIFSFRLGKKLSLDLKLIPNILILDYGKARIQNPLVFSGNQLGTRNYNLPEINFASSLQLRYLLKEPDKRRRR